MTVDTALAERASMRTLALSELMHMVLARKATWSSSTDQVHSESAQRGSLKGGLSELLRVLSSWDSETDSLSRRAWVIGDD